MEKSILENYNIGQVPSKTDYVSSAVRNTNANLESVFNINTQYNRQLENEPIDDYEALYLLDKDNPEQTIKEKSYLKDAWNTFLNSRDQINLMSERAKLAKDINPVLEDINFELDYLNGKKRLQELEAILPVLDTNSDHYKTLLSEFINLQAYLTNNKEKYDATLNKYNETEGDSIDNRIAYLNNSKQSWEEERSKVNEDIRELYADIRKRSDDYTPSSEFRLKEQKAQDKPWYSPDYLLYAGPGLTGSSTATVEGYVADALATGVLWLGRHYATTGALNAVPATAAISNLIGWGEALTATALSVVGNIYSRHKESLAQVYGAYRSRIEKELENQGIDIRQYAQLGRDQLKRQDPNIDTTKISDDEIIDRVISGEINISDDYLNSVKKSSEDGLERVYDNNMALSAMDVAQSALVFAPVGKAIGKVISAPIKPIVNAVTKVSTPIKDKIDNVIDAYTGFNARLAYNSPIKNAALNSTKALTRLGFSATSEAFEEGNQDIFDYDYISGRYDKESSNVFKSLLGLANANYRTAKILSGIDTESELAKDPQFWNDVKGGFALGLYMGGPTIAYHSGVKTYKDLVANSFVRDLVADNIGKKDVMNKATYYAEVANKKWFNYQQNVLDVLENYKYNLPEGITEQDVNDEIITAKNIMNLAKSKTNHNLIKKMGYGVNTTEYNTMIGLQHMAQTDMQEAFNNAAVATETERKFYADMLNDPSLNNYSEEDKKVAVDLTRLNIQKLALQQLETALKSIPESNTQKFGITNPNNSIGNSIAKEIPNIIKNIDSNLEELSKDTKFSKNFVATPHLVQQGIDTYINELIANQDALMAEHKMNEIFGNVMEDDKLVNFDNASEESKRKVANNIKNRINKYIEDSNESARIVEENAKQVVETETQKEKEKQASTVVNPEDAPTTNNKSEVNESISTKLSNDKTTPKSSILDPEAKPDLDSNLEEEEFVENEEVEEPKQTKKETIEYQDSDDFATKSLEQLAEEYENTRKNIKKQAAIVEEKKEEKLDSVEEESDDDEFVVATEKDLLKASAEDANEVEVESKEDKKVSQTYNNNTSNTTVEKKIEWARQKIATEQKMDRRTDMDSETRSLEDSLSVEELVKDKVSHTLYFDPLSETPMYPGVLPGKKLAEAIKDPAFFDNSFCEFIINKNYTEKNSKPYVEGDASTYDSASILMLIHHSTGDYAMALKTPKGAKKLLAMEWVSLSQQNYPSSDLELVSKANEKAVEDLIEFRNGIITTLERIGNNETVIPSTITRTNGEFDVNRKATKVSSGSESGTIYGEAIFRPVQEVKGFNIPQDPYKITPQNVTIGISNGIVNNNLILGANGEILPGKGGSGQIFIYPPKSNTPSNQLVPVQVNLKRFSKEEASFLADLLINYGATPTAEYKSTGIVAKELIDFMVRFGDATKVTSDDTTFDWLRKKQLYIDEKGNLVIGQKVFNISNISNKDKQDIINALQDNNFHWRAARKNFYSPISTALPSVAELFNRNSDLKELEIIPGIKFTSEQFSVKNPMYTMGLFISNNLLTSDLKDNLFKSSFAYADDIQVVNKRINDPEVKEAADNKVNNLQTVVTVPEPQINLQEAATENPTSEDDAYINKISNNGTIDPFAISEDDDIDFPARKITGAINEIVSAEEIKWFRNKLGLPEDSLTIVEDAIALGSNEYAMGLVREDSTILWKGAERGTLYHEAYHRISLLTISPRERRKIYDFYRNRTGFVGSDKQVEEALAEEFRQYMLNKVEPQLNIIKRAWKAIKNFISKWVWRTDTNIDNIFERISTGYYNRTRQNSQAVSEFLAEYSGKGAPFKYRGHQIKNITNTQFKETVNSLLASLFTLNNVKLKDDVRNLNYGVLKSALNPDVTEKLVANGVLTEEQGKVRNEIYEKFDDVFKPAIISKLSNYQLRVVDKQENIDEEIDEKEAGSAVGDQMANYIQEQLAVSVKDNALASIKIFIATLPKTTFVTKEKKNDKGETVKVQTVQVVKSPVTGLPLMIDFDKSWNTIINELHSENTFKDMLNKCAKLSKVNPLFKTLYNELYKMSSEYVSKKGIQETESQKIARENLQTQFRNTFRKARHKLVGIISEKVENEKGNEQTNLYVKDESANKVSKNILEGWNYGLTMLSNIFNITDGVYQLNTNEDGKKVLDAVIEDFNFVKGVIQKYQNKPNVKLKNGLTYKEYIPQAMPIIKNRIVNDLNKVGVDIDLDTLNSFLTREYYNTDPVTSLVSFFNDGTNKGIDFFFNNKIKELNNIQENGTVLSGGYKRSITKYYNDSKLLGRLSETYAMLHPSSDELSVLSTDGKLLYPISDHNYLSDNVQKLDTDHAAVEAFTHVLYNTGNNDNPNYFKGSYLLTNLYNNSEVQGKIGFETLVYFKEQGSADKGRKYTEISPLEDYIAKMTFTQAGRIILPTMGDSQTYNTLYGSAIDNFKNPLDVSKGEIMFDSKILRRFINYFETELDTIEFNYKNEGNLTEEQKIKNYDTGARNGYRFRYFSGFFRLKEQPTLNGMSFTKDFSNFNEALSLAEDLGGSEYALSIVNQIRNSWNSMDSEEKSKLMNNYLLDALKDELNYAAELGIIKWDGNKLASVESLALPQKVLNEAISHYTKIDKFSKYSKNLGALELISNYFANTISSVIEFEKLFIKDPAYYKDPVDKIKRLREVLSTGVTPRLDYEEGNPMSDLTEVNVGTLSDNVIVSRQAEVIAEYAKRSAVVRLLQEMYGLSQERAMETYVKGEPLPADVEDAANLIVKDKFNGYLNPKGKVNQTDATVLISPEFYKQLVRRVDGWTPEVAKAFDLLNDPNADLDSDIETYAEALAVTLKPLKFMYFGDHFDVTAKRDIPIFDKMAMFPVHRIFSTGDMGKVLEVMEKRNIHMLAFESAVKVGQRVKEVKSKIYTDKTNKEIDMEGLMSMPLHKQSLSNFRRQLITDPHHADRQMFVSQAQKAAMGNIRDNWKYFTPDGVSYTGRQVIDNFNGAHNAITGYGRKEIENDFGITPDNPQASVVEFAKILQRKAENSNMNDNVIEGLNTEDGKSVAPISGLSDNSWIESGLISMLNKSIVDVNLPGGMFIQMSSILYNRLAVTSDAQNERKLNFANPDGTMDCVISINLLKHIIPNYDKMTFREAKKWLIDHEVIGPNTRALAMGYRIPAQGQASTAALKVVDVYPEQIGDTITLPDEFTTLTGSDFDIDKLFIARYNYDNNGKRVKFETKDQYEQRLKDLGFEDEDVARMVYNRYNGKTDFEANSREANENLLLDMYLSVISNPMNFAEARQPLDTVTDYLKDKILKDVDNLTGQGKRQSKSQLYFATPAFQSRTKAELNGGKVGIAPFALANAHQVLTQLVKLKFKPNKILSQYNISDLHQIQSSDENKINILDWLSALINAHVDVAKDPYIIRLNVRKLTFNMTNFLIRTGKGESTFYFLPQQILKDFATEYDRYSGFYNVDTGGRNPENLAFQTVWDKYYKEARKLSKGKYDGLLDYLVTTGVGQEQRASMFNLDYLRKQLVKKDTFDWYYNQLVIMKAYQELTPFSKSLSELTKLSQIDTKKFGNNFGLQSAFLDKWKQYMIEQNVFENPVKVFSNTFLGKKMTDALVFPRIAFKNIMIRLTPEFENIRSLVEFYTRGYAISDDVYINNITRSMEASYKAKFFNNYFKETNTRLKDLLYGPNSIVKRLELIKADIRDGKYPNLLDSSGAMNNVLLENIMGRVKETATEQIGPDFIAYKPNKSGDNNLENEIIRAWEELWDSDYDEVRKFAKDLAIYSFYTSGDAFGKNNIFRYVPNSIKEAIGYFDYIRDLEANPDKLSETVNVFDTIKNLWWNDHAVPAIDYYKLDSSVETIEEEGRPVYKPVRHEDSGITVTNKNGEEVSVPSIVYDEKASKNGILAFNKNGSPIYSIYKKIKLDRNNDPRTTFLYEYIGVTKEKGIPVYRLINKKGINYNGNVLVENGRNRSQLPYNNVVSKDTVFTPEEDIVWVTDLTPEKATLQSKLFNESGEFNENLLSDLMAKVDETKPSETETTTEGDTRRTYSGMITSLKPNQIFVFGSNTQGRHGKGAALTAKNKFGAVYGQAEGPQGQSYAIITKDLTKSTHPSRTPEQIKEQIHNLYEYARQNPDKEFLIAYSGTGENLNAYSNQEMADMFSSELIPKNIIFEEEFYKLIHEQDNKITLTPEATDTAPVTNADENAVLPKDYTNHSGGATGSDTAWLEIGKEFGVVNQKHYYHGTKTPNGNTEISEEDYNEGRYEAAKAANYNYGYKYDTMKDDRLIRNWAQVKYSDEIVAIGHLVKRGEKLFPSKANDTRVAENVAVTGGTGYAVAMAILHNKPVYVYDQVRKQWYKNIEGKWSKSEVPTLTKNFAGIGTREINEDGKQAIRDVYEKTFGAVQSKESVSENVINIYAGTGENADLSNFAVRPFEYQGLKFDTVEGAFQFAKLNYAGKQIEDENGRTVADKLLDPNLTGAQARSLGRRIQNLNTEEWDANSSRIMKEIIKTSFEQNPEALQRLLNTGDAVFTHTQDKSKWGTEFPKLLMEVRDELRSEQTSAETSSETTTVETSTQDFLQYANKFGYTAEIESLKKDLEQAKEEVKQIEDKYTFVFNDGFRVPLNFKLNNQQVAVLRELENFIDNGDTTITLSGYAGTGKTTIMGIFNKYLVHRSIDAIFSAPTHRANAVTRLNNPKARINTLQSLLGIRAGFDLNEETYDLNKLKFEQQAEVQIGFGDLIIVDESSMIKDPLYDLLQETATQKKAQIIYVGDKGQIRPVNSKEISKVFRNSEAQLQLTKVERTGDNPILKESTRVRNGEGFSYQTEVNADGSGVEFVNNDTREQEYIKSCVDEMYESGDMLHFRILTATNKNAAKYNNTVRAIRYGRRPEQLRKGDLLVGFDNREYNSKKRSFNLINSGDYVVQDVEPTKINVTILDQSGKIEKITMDGFKTTLKSALDDSADPFVIDIISNTESEENIIKVKDYITYLWSEQKKAYNAGDVPLARQIVQKINGLQKRLHTMKNVEDSNGRLKVKKSLDYGYALTIHKSQGGTYSKVLIDDSSINTFGPDSEVNKQVREELRYVAISRAKNYAMVQTKNTERKTSKMQEEIIIDNFDENEEFVEATSTDLMKASSNDTNELIISGKKRRQECE